MESNIYPFKDQINILINENKSAAEVARMVDVSETTVRKWRKGLGDPSRENLITIAEIFNVNLLWLATGQGPKKKGDAEYGETQSTGNGSLGEPSNGYTAKPKKTMEEVGEVMRSAREKYDNAVEAADYRPGKAVEEHIKSLIFSAELKCNVDFDNIISLLVALKEDSNVN